MRIDPFESRLAQFKKLPALEAARKTMEITMMMMTTASTRDSDYGMTCAQCGNLMIAPECAEFEDDRHVVNLWRCEKCGNQFEFKAFVPVYSEPDDDMATEEFYPSLLVA
jgi:ribosomal protein L37AE/L43A